MIVPEVFEVAHLFTRASVRYWVFGGNGVELCVGRSLRAHNDLNFFVSSTQASDAVNLLEGAGWVCSSGSLEQGDVFLERGDLILDLVPINDLRSPPHTQGELERIVWPGDFLIPYPTQAGIITLRPEMHLEMKTLIREFYGLEQVRAKDLLDQNALCSVLV